MDFVLYIVFSSLEYLAIFALTFALFRFEYKVYHNSVLFVSAMLAFVSYSIRISFDQPIIDPIATVLLMYAFMHYIFQVQVFYSAVMTVTGYIAYGIVQSSVIFGLDLVGILTLEQVKPNTIYGYVTQLVSIAIALVITALLKRKNFGFAYVPHGHRANVKYRGLNRLFLITLILASAMAWITLYYNVEASALPFFLMTIPLIVIFGFLIYLSVRKEKNDD